MFEQIGHEAALGAFVMLGVPDLRSSAKLLDALVVGGADMIEVGIPFSDPVADGPIIQAAALHALNAGVRVADCFELIAAFRARHSNVPVGILTYANLVVARPGFMHDAASAGADSLLIADIPAFEAEPYVLQMEQAAIEPVLIAAPNTPDATLERIAKLSNAYTYCVSRPGITGTHADGRFDSRLIERLCGLGAPPQVFGFGISKVEHVRAAISAGARGVICGSAIVESAALGEDVTQLIRSLKAATRERLAAAMN
jgi:tryptophan synthase alpha chain